MNICVIIIYFIMILPEVIQDYLEEVEINTHLADKGQIEGVKDSDRIFGVSIMITQVAILFIYGFSAYGSNWEFYSENDSQNAYRTPYYEVFSIVIMSMFVMLGFGLLLSLYRYGNWLGLTTAIVVVALSAQIGPLFQKFWFNVIITNFGQTHSQIEMGANIYNFWSHLNTDKMGIGYINNHITYQSCISILTFMTAVIGLLNAFQVLVITFMFQLFWNINYFLLVYICVIRQDHNDAAKYTPYFFDQFGSTYVYLFAALFGLVFSLMVNKCSGLGTEARNNEMNKVSLVMAFMGTVFIFATFMFSFNNLIAYTTFGENVARFNMLWALSGSVVGTYVGSGLAGRGRVGYKQAIVGTISGGVIMASAAPLVANIGIAMMLGAIAGLISGLYMKLLHPKITANFNYDAMGLFGPFLINALLGSIVVTPCVLAWDYDRGTPNAGIGWSYYSTLIGWQLTYVAISVVIASFSGFMTSLPLLCFSLTPRVSNFKTFSNNLGLYSKKDSQDPNIPEHRID